MRTIYDEEKDQYLFSLDNNGASSTSSVADGSSSELTRLEQMRQSDNDARARGTLLG